MTGHDVDGLPVDQRTYVDHVVVLGFLAAEPSGVDGVEDACRSLVESVIGIAELVEPTLGLFGTVVGWADRDAHAVLVDPQSKGPEVRVQIVDRCA